MELFDKKFVYFMWDESLRGKECFYDDDIDELRNTVNENDTDFKDCLEPGTTTYPFRPVLRGKAPSSWRFAYYDPNYECKVAYSKGSQIQHREKGKSVWHDGTPAWDEKFEYRIKPVTYYVGIGCSKSLTWDFVPAVYKHVYASFDNPLDADKWIEAHKKFVPVMRAFEKGLTIEYKLKCSDWTIASTPSWDLRLRYRVKPVYNSLANKPCNIQEPMKRRMTNRELAKWLAEGKGQKASINGNALTYHTYELNKDNEPVYDCMIRAWNEPEWHEPEVVKEVR
jgi:hypothetical protein